NPPPGGGQVGSGGGFSNIEGRAVPDVAFLADSETGVAVYTHDVQNGNVVVGWQVIGGTSLGAPAWAGLIALANEIRVANGQGTMDGATQTRPTLLTLGAGDYHDITVGFIGQDYAGNDVYAGPGYDEITGLGSPLADLL